MLFKSSPSRQTGGILFAFVFAISRLSKTRAVQSFFDRIRANLLGTPSVKHAGAFGNPKPRSGIHVTLNNPPQRLVIVGDVHGCLEELGDLLYKCHWDREKDGLIFVGDLVNKGNFSAGVIRFARESGGLCVRGNHDDSAIRHIFNWKNNGVEPPESYDYIKELSSEDIDWFVNLPYSLSIPSYNAIVVHAGLVPGVPLDEQDGSDMYQMRNLVSSCKDTSTATAGSCGAVDESSSGKSVSSTVSEWKATASGKEGVAWASEWKVKDGPHVYFGHDAKRGLQLFDNATGLDTGCCYGRKLSAMILPERKLVQVDARMVYKEPKEKDT